MFSVYLIEKSPRSHPSTEWSHLLNFYVLNRVPLKSTTLHDNNIRRSDYNKIHIAKRTKYFRRALQQLHDQTESPSVESDNDNNEMYLSSEPDHR
ncbi:hypothetical protein [Pseudoplusia includens SNPV IE]|uniref:Uncharacterized protein n=1 Tax=Pseudoplusia includens SNPV IE TaxID=1592335 RepID=A0A0B5A192_9ABAC|nr:hypothetical protein [Pseudoplusia includens SNPV IE]AJD80760.1 hypothetical protein [Pseudoplusia includens SNPV IE]